MGSNNEWIGNRQYNRPRIAMFPYTGNKVHTNATASLDGRVYLGSVKGGTSNVLYRVNAGGRSVSAGDSGPDWIDDSGSDSPYRNSGSVGPAGTAIAQWTQPSRLPRRVRLTASAGRPATIRG